VHEVELVLLQVTVEELPKVTVVGLAVMVTVGAGVAGVATEKLIVVEVEMFPAVSLHPTK
jgi:hypothetical protein